VSRYLKEQKPLCRTVLADPMGSALYNWVKTGTLKSEGASAVTEGIGIGRVTANLEGSPIDDAVRIEDDEIVRTGYQLLHREGLFLGGTSGANVAAAVRVARELGPGNTVVTILCDGGHKYLSRFWSRDYLEQKGSSRTPTRQPAARSRREPGPPSLRRPARDALGAGRPRAGAPDPGHPDRARRGWLDGRPP